MAMRFEDLKLEVGKRFRLTVVGLDYKRHRCEAKLVGYQPGVSIVVMLPEKPAQVLLHRALKVEAELALPQGVASFNSIIDDLGEAPRSFLQLRYPEEVAFRKLRAEFRVPTDVPVEVYAHTDLGMTVNAIHGYTQDLSFNGACLVLEKELTRMVRKISIGLFLSGPMGERDMTVSAELKAVARPDDVHGECPFAYGVRLVEADEQDMLFMRAYCLHQALERRYQLCWA